MESWRENRHCAFCLTSIPTEQVKLCGGCHRRAYCSRDCQRKDWTPKKCKVVGQGHKNWCSLGVCEEDVDWKVVAVEGKGLGVVAFKDIPSKARIMVEGCLLSPYGDARVDDLMPINGTLESKFLLNRLGSIDGNAVLCLRMSRVNHNCSPNAGHYCVAKFNVAILFAERDIKKGEEICISYSMFNSTAEKSVEESRTKLKLNWGIVCGADCVCNDRELRSKSDESRELASRITQLRSSKGQPDQVLRAVELLMTNHEILHTSWSERVQTLNSGIQEAITQRKTLAVAKDYSRQLVEICQAITHPTDPWLTKHQHLMGDLSRHRNYLICD